MKNSVSPKYASAFDRRMAGLRALLSGAAARLCWLLPCLIPAMAHAANDNIVRSDGRLQGYANSVTLPEAGGYFGTWVMLLVLGALVTLVVFKNARRTHLD
jgi:Na+/melibiose symporter-like transporter